MAPIPYTRICVWLSIVVATLAVSPLSHRRRSLSSCPVMNRAPASQRQRQTQYLIIYNVVCVTLWVAVLGRVLLLVPLVGFQNVYGGVGNFVKWTQTLAVLEVVHSALGVYSSHQALNRDIQTATTNRALSICCRSRPFSALHHSHASRLTAGTRLGDRQCVSCRHGPLTFLHYHDSCLVHH